MPAAWLLARQAGDRTDSFGSLLPSQKCSIVGRFWQIVRAQVVHKRSCSRWWKLTLADRNVARGDKGTQTPLYSCYGKNNMISIILREKFVTDLRVAGLPDVGAVFALPSLLRYTSGP